MIEEDIAKIREIIFREKKTCNELNALFIYLKNADEQEKRMLEIQIEKLKDSLRRTNNELLEILERTNPGIPIEKGEKKIREISENKRKEKKKEEDKKGTVYEESRISELDREILKRLKKKEKKPAEKKEKKASRYVQIANNLFADSVKSMIKQKRFTSLEKDLIKSNLEYTSVTYVSILLFTVILSAIAAFLIFGFFFFFNITPEMPIIVKATESAGERFLKVFWIILAVPLGTFLFMYLYPSLEKKSAENRINQELPFATIHMSAIAGSMIEPTKIFSIISSTREYPNLEKEFNKLLNEINIYGYDIVTALKDMASNTPSQKLAELFNGLATTITSGGDLYDFFDKRSQSLLFEYRLDKEKKTKTAETFMDIYISVVIAAPMILMLLLMMMKISGLGVAFSTATITVLVVGGVSLINIFFLIFLQLKQPKGI
jgi:Flp pilus assembly protein TadB